MLDIHPLVSASCHFFFQSPDPRLNSTSRRTPRASVHDHDPWEIKKVQTCHPISRQALLRPPLARTRPVMRGVEELMEGDLLEVNGESLPLASTRVGRKPWRRRRIWCHACSLPLLLCTNERCVNHYFFWGAGTAAQTRQPLYHFPECGRVVVYIHCLRG